MNKLIFLLFFLLFFGIIACTSLNTSLPEISSALLDNKNMIFGQGYVEFTKKQNKIVWENNKKIVQKKARVKAIKNIEKKIFNQVYTTIIKFTEKNNDYEDEVFYEFADGIARKTINSIWKNIQVYKTVFKKDNSDKIQKVYVFVSILKEDILKIIQQGLVYNESAVIETINTTKMVEEIKNKLER